MGGVLGACHGLDVPLVFGNLDRGQPAMLIGETPSAGGGGVSARMRAAWTSFAADGDPGWPAYDTERRLVQRFEPVGRHRLPGGGLAPASGSTTPLPPWASLTGSADERGRNRSLAVGDKGGRARRPRARILDPYI